MSNDAPVTASRPRGQNSVKPRRVQRLVCAPQGSFLRAKRAALKVCLLRPMPVSYFEPSITLPNLIRGGVHPILGGVRTRPLFNSFCVRRNVGARTRAYQPREILTNWNLRLFMLSHKRIDENHGSNCDARKLLASIFDRSSFDHKIAIIPVHLIQASQETK